ncbi:MAG: hypothetical protein ACOCUF_01690 [Patescibacteria group bacterium]
MKNDLDFLFGSRVRWRLVKFFILNAKEAFPAQEIFEKNKFEGKETKKEAKKVLMHLERGRFLYSRNQKGKKLYYLNTRSPFYSELKGLVVKSNIYPQCKQLTRIKNLGEVKLALVAGLFINSAKSKTDLLIVADNVSRAKLKHLIEDLEAEMGKEINYSLMDLQEFRYRLKMFDKFILELLEQPHEIIINKVENMIKEAQKMRG